MSKSATLSAATLFFVQDTVDSVSRFYGNEWKYSETSVKRTPIKRTPSNGHQLTSYISLYNEPLFSEHPTELIVVLDYVLEIRIVVD